MSFRNLFFLDDEWRALMKQAQTMEKNSLDTELLGLAVERHLRKHLDQQIDVSELQKPYVAEYKSQIEKAIPNVTAEEMNKMVATHLEAIDNLATSIVDRSFEIMDVFVDQFEKAIMEHVEHRLRIIEAGMDDKIEVKMGALPIEKEKHVLESLDANPVIHESDLIRYLSKKKGNNGYKR